MDVRHFLFVLDEEDHIIGGQLELGTILDPALSVLDLVIDFSKFLSREKKKLSKATRSKRKGKRAETRSGDDPDNRRTSDPYQCMVYMHYDQ